MCLIGGYLLEPIVQIIQVLEIVLGMRFQKVMVADQDLTGER